MERQYPLTTRFFRNMKVIGTRKLTLPGDGGNLYLWNVGPTVQINMVYKVKVKVKVKVTLRLTVSQSVCLGVKPKSGTFDHRLMTKTDT
jgi:hypothetical protein